MKKKIKNSNSVRKVPTGAEVRAQGTIVLSIQQIDPDDPSLPPPPGAKLNKNEGPINPNEARKLAQTKAFGGLLP